MFVFRKLRGRRRAVQMLFIYYFGLYSFLPQNILAHHRKLVLFNFRIKFSFYPFSPFNLIKILFFFAFLFWICIYIWFISIFLCHYHQWAIFNLQAHSNIYGMSLKISLYFNLLLLLQGKYISYLTKHWKKWWKVWHFLPETAVVNLLNLVFALFVKTEIDFSSDVVKVYVINSIKMLIKWKLFCTSVYFSEWISYYKAESIFHTNYGKKKKP